MSETPAYIDAFLEAVYPGAGALASSSFKEPTILRDATEALTTLRAKLAEAERERDEARDSDRESLEMYRRCRDERDALRSRVESQAEELGRRSDHADGLEHERDAARRERDALAAKLERVREWARKQNCCSRGDCTGAWDCISWVSFQVEEILS